METGEGVNPRPAGRHPQWRYPHGPLHGKALEKYRARLSPGYRHDCPRPSWAGEEAEGRAGWGLWDEPSIVETGVGGCSPSPRAAAPNGDTPTVHCMERLWRSTVHGFLPAIAMTAPAPRGRGRRPKAGRGGGYQKVLHGRDRGGGMLPPPRRPLPRRRYPHGPLHGEIPEKTRARLPTGLARARLPLLAQSWCGLQEESVVSC